MSYRRIPAVLSLSSLKTVAAVLLPGMAMLIAMLPAAANGFGPVGQEAPEIQRAVSANDEGCLPEPVAAPKAPSSSAPAPVFDHRCWVDYAEAEKGQAVWVDVRPLPEMRAAPMPGALQILLHQVSTKAFLKEALAVLIGNGVDDAEMAMACHQLKEAGFAQLRMLRHGARAWHRAGQPLLGNAETIMALDTIDAGYFHRGRVAGVWQVIGVDLPTETPATPSSKTISAIRGMKTIDAGNPDQTVDKLEATIRELRQARAGETPVYAPTTVIVTADEAAMQQLRQHLRERLDKFGTPFPENVLWLAGGWHDYAAFVEQQQRMAAIAADPPPLRRPCGS